MEFEKKGEALKIDNLDKKKEETDSFSQDTIDDFLDWVDEKRQQFSEATTDKRKNLLGFSPENEDDFLKWKEEKREGKSKNEVSNINSLIEPMSQNQSNNNKPSYIDAELDALQFDGDSMDSNKSEKELTKVPNKILKLLIHDYKRLKRLESAYKAGRLGIKENSEN